MISLDWTTLFTIILFILLMVALNKIMYQPVLARMKERRRKIEDAEKNVEKAEKEMKKLRRDISSKIVVAELEAEETMSSAIEDADRIKHEIIREANNDFDKKVASHRKELSKTVQKTRENLEPEISELVKLVMKKILPVILMMLISTPIFYSIPAATAESMHENQHTDHSDHHGLNETARIINFVILISALYILLRRPIGNAMSNRIETIRTRLDDSRRAEKEAAEASQKIQQEYANVFQKLEEIEISAQEKAEKNKLNIQKDAHQKADKIASDTENVIHSEEEKAIRHLRRFVVDHTFQQIESEFEKGISHDTDKKLVDVMLDGFDQNPNLPRNS